MRKTFFVIALLMMSTLAQAAMPNQITVQGRLTDANEVPVPSASYNFEFRVYDDLSGGSLVWPIEYQSLSINNGVFSAFLNPPSNTPFDKPYFLETWVNGNRLTPRVNITSSGYAFYANVAGSISPGNLDMKNYDVYNARYVNASVLYDKDNLIRYVDPSTQTHLAKLYLYDVLSMSSFITMGGNDIDNVRYLNASAFYDRDNAAYYIDPAGTSQMNYVNAVRYYTGTRYLYDGGTSGITSSDNITATNYVKGSSGLCIGADCRNAWPSSGSGTVTSVSAGTGLSASPSNPITTSGTLSVVYGSAAGTAAQGNNQITVSAGTGLSGGGAMIIGAGGSTTISMNTAGISSCTDSTNNKIYWDSTNSRLGCGTDQKGSSDAPVGAAYIVQTYDSTLTNERLLTAGAGISITDGGANNPITIANSGDLSNTNEIQNIITNKGLQRDASNNFGIINCADGQIMKYSAGVWSCQADNTGGSTPSGTDGQVQYNNGGSFGGATSLYYDDVNSRAGIGTSAPGNKLDVAGSTEAIYSRNSAGGGYAYLGYSDAGGYGRIGSYSGGWRNLVINDAAPAAQGYVGIGTSSPAYKLDVAGDIRATGNVNAGYQIINAQCSSTSCTASCPAGYHVIGGGCSTHASNIALWIDAPSSTAGTAWTCGSLATTTLEAIAICARMT